MIKPKGRRVEKLRLSMRRSNRKLRRVITERSVRQYLKLVHETGVSRCKAQGDKFSPACYAAGALVFLRFVDRLDMMPANWFFGMHLGGRNPFQENENAERQHKV